MELLTREEVLHVATLARLQITENEVEKYKEQLTAIMTEIDKIHAVSIDEQEIPLIAPIFHDNCYTMDEASDCLRKEEIFKNSKNHFGDYMVVPQVIEHD